mgnify:FL=1
MKFLEAVQRCHVRAGIFRTGQNPRIIYAKNHEIPLENRVSPLDRLQDDWEECDPEDDYSISGSYRG